MTNNNATAIRTGDGDGGMMTLLIVAGDGHEAAAQQWADEYNAARRKECDEDGLGESWYGESMATLRPATVYTASTMPPVNR